MLGLVSSFLSPVPEGRGVLMSGVVAAAATGVGVVTEQTLSGLCDCSHFQPVRS